jgi:uncharacterized protein YkwD
VPVKTKTSSKKFPRHYAKVYWPYLPLALILAAGLWLGRPSADPSLANQLALGQISTSSLLAQTNQQRLKAGQAALKLNSQLVSAANSKVNAMVSQNYWSPSTPYDSTLNQSVISAGYKPKALGQNLAYGFDSSAQAVSGWMSNSLRRASLLNANYSDVGFGIKSSSNFISHGPAIVIVAIYGAPAQNAAATTVVNQQEPATPANSPTQAVSKAAVLTNGQLPWIGFALAIAGISGILFLVVKHSISLQRRLRRGERYVMRHRILDLTIIAFAALCALLCQSVGFIR